MFALSSRSSKLMEKVVYFLSFSQYALDENAIVVIDHTIKCSSKKLECFIMKFSPSFSFFCGEGLAIFFYLFASLFQDVQPLLYSFLMSPSWATSSAIKPIRGDISTLENGDIIILGLHIQKKSRKKLLIYFKICLPYY